MPKAGSDQKRLTGKFTNTGGGESGGRPIPDIKPIKKTRWESHRVVDACDVVWNEETGPGDPADDH
jgi:hypothetical protein